MTAPNKPENVWPLRRCEQAWLPAATDPHSVPGMENDVFFTIKEKSVWLCRESRWEPLGNLRGSFFSLLLFCLHTPSHTLRNCLGLSHCPGLLTAHFCPALSPQWTPFFILHSCQRWTDYSPGNSTRPLLWVTASGASPGVQDTQHTDSPAPACSFPRTHLKNSFNGHCQTPSLLLPAN